MKIKQKRKFIIVHWRGGGTFHTAMLGETNKEARAYCRRRFPKREIQRIEIY